MCCTSARTNPHRFVAASSLENCGCGCIGQNPSKIRLETLRDHLKVELKAVEKRIKELDEAPS